MFFQQLEEVLVKIFTHFNVDLDAVCSVWAARQFMLNSRNVPVEFRPADWNGDEMEDNDLALDIDASGRGLKGRKGEGGIVHSCFASIVAQYASVYDQEALANLVRFVDAQDAHGSAVKFLVPSASREAQQTIAMTGINAVLRALQNTHQRNDALVVLRMSEILSGMLHAGRARERAITEANKMEIIAAGTVAIVLNSKEYATNGILFEERNVRAIVYVDGCNIGLIRHSDESLRMDHNEIVTIVSKAGETNEWFAHSAGFLYCRGSRKAPSSTMSKVNPRELAEAVGNLLNPNI